MKAEFCSLDEMLIFTKQANIAAVLKSSSIIKGKWAKNDTLQSIHFQKTAGGLC